VDGAAPIDPALAARTPPADAPAASTEPTGLKGRREGVVGAGPGAHPSA